MKLKILLSIFLLNFSFSIFAVEKVLNFHSDIIVNKDGSLRVIETFDVVTEKKEIKRGIVREYPTIYKTEFDFNYGIGFKLESVARNGSLEPYHIENAPNGKRIFIGSPSELLKPGVYTYTIKYKTQRQIGFQNEFDELYLNIIGTGFKFPIDNASATIKLPNIPFDKISIQAYTGYMGSITGNYVATKNPETNTITFKTTRQLMPYEAFTILLTWPKNFIKEPTIINKAIYFINDNPGFTGLVFLALILLIYYLIIYFLFGRSPRPGTIIPLFEPPNKLTPGAVKLINSFKYDNKAFAADIIDMAVKGFLIIKSLNPANSFFKDVNAYYLVQNKKPSEDSSYYGLYNLLFKNKAEINLQKDKELLIKDYKYQKNKTESLCKNKYLVDNSNFIAIGIVISVFAGGILFALNIEETFWIFFPAIFIAAINIIFFFLLRTYTKEGRKVADQIEGFKMFLTFTEKERLNFLGTTAKSPEEYEIFLPYAVALGVEQIWTKQFAPVFEKLKQEGKEYRPKWYIGSGFRPYLISQSISAATTAISSASTLPRSGGSRGSGRSGSGFGGGGMGGW